MKITGGTVITCSPGRNFVTLKLETDEGIYGLGDATLNGRELAVASYLDRSRAAGDRRPGRAAHRRHLAVPLQGRVLAARSGDHDGHRGGRHGAVGHQGQGAQRARLPVAGRRLARRGDGLRPRQRRHDRRRRSTRWAATCRSGYKAVRAQCSVPGLPQHLRHRPGRSLRARGTGRGVRDALEQRALSRIGARRCSSASAASSAPTSTCCTTSTTG